MNKKPVLLNHVRIRQGKAWIKNDLFLEHVTDEGFFSFSRALYRALDLSYPKFFKMDDLCKLALLASEMLKKDTDVFQRYTGNRIAIVLANRASSLETDRTFYDSIADARNYFPSPSVFVYTLPNISIGEISIRNAFTGEHVFLILDSFDGVPIFDYVSELFESNRADACIFGWSEFDQGKEDAFFILAENKMAGDSVLGITVEEINKLYKRKIWQ